MRERRLIGEAKGTAFACKNTEFPKRVILVVRGGETGKHIGSARED